MDLELGPGVRFFSRQAKLIFLAEAYWSLMEVEAAAWPRPARRVASMVLRTVLHARAPKVMVARGRPPSDLHLRVKTRPTDSVVAVVVASAGFELTQELCETQA